MVLLSQIELDGEEPGPITDDDVIVVNAKEGREGRAAARQAWAWDGTPSVLTLSWNPDGTQHDFGQKYLSKKHCMCCGFSGFRRHCTKCRKNFCPECSQGTDRSKVIPCFYTKKDDVPFQGKFYGAVNCFLLTCARRDSQGFQTEEDMRMHAMSRHTKQYEAHEAVKRATQTSELDTLREQINLLLAAQLRGGQPPEVVINADSTPSGKIIQDLAGNMIDPPLLSDLTILADAAKAPLYISDKPPKPTKARKKRKSK